MPQDQSLRSRLARAHDVGDLLLPLISLFSDGVEFAECGAVRVNSAGADTRHYVYGERSRPPGRSGGWGRAKDHPAEAGGGWWEWDERWRRSGGTAVLEEGAQAWNEMRVLISPGQVGSLWPSVWSGVGASDRIEAGRSAGNSNGRAEWVKKKHVTFPPQRTGMSCLMFCIYKF